MLKDELSSVFHYVHKGEHAEDRISGISSNVKSLSLLLRRNERSFRLSHVIQRDFKGNLKG